MRHNTAMKRQHHPAQPIAQPKTISRRGVVLVAVLLVVALLSLASYQYADLMTSEYKASENATRYAQAKANAESGVHYLAAMLSDPNAVMQLNGNFWDNSQFFQDQIVRQDSNPRYSGKFSIVSPPYDPTNSGTMTGFRFGVIDEASKINPNALMMVDPTGNTLYKMLMLLPNMTSDVACAIVDWIDPDENTFSAPDGSGSTGAESSYYSGLNPPYQCKNAALDSLEELLLVRGVTPQLLFGGDKNRNGVQDGDEQNPDGMTFDGGWASYLTIYSKEMNLSSTGTPRITLTNSNLDTLYNNISTAIGDEDTAKFIVLYLQYGPSAAPTTSKTTGGSTGGGSTGGTSKTTGAASKTTTTATTQSSTGSSSASQTGTVNNVSRNSMTLTTAKASTQLTSMYSLINTYVSVPSTDPKGQPTIYPSPLNDPGKLATILPVMLDQLTVNPDPQILGRININSAPQNVLMALQGVAPELTSDLIQQIVTQRPSLDSSYQANPTYNTPAWLITQLGVSPTTMAKLDKYITATTQVYRFQVLGYFDGGGPVARIEAVIDTNNGAPLILYQRDITDLGKGFDLSQYQQ